LINKQRRFILVIAFSIPLFFIACNKSNDTTPIKKTDTQNNNSSENKQIGIQEQLGPQNKVPFIDTTPVPKVIIPPKVISSFATVLLDQHKNRIDNIKLASQEINNYTLIPGGTFSFNGIVGKRGEGIGYKKAKILVEGEREVAIGGGICQLSSTIYQAAKKLNLKIIERHSHSADVHYIPIGEDAAVNYKNKDLKFINNKDYSIQFKIRIKKGKLIVTILKI
jgi:vancomycin resistance protein YoaR